ncbi:unnamed protein product [Orchesella dallaii]|uniref:ENT domain-containing protein n=1 Tax=Orchesella dallaii TaxID=48710 RepID=A0ABP1Q8J3_9HEXA
MMEEDIKLELEEEGTSAALIRNQKLHFQRELRGLELKAYSGVLEALRASGKPNSEKETVIKTLRDFFHISEDRHKAELRVLAYDDRLSLICRQLSGYNFTEEWAGEAQRVYIPLSNQSYSLYHAHPSTSANYIKSQHQVRVLQKAILEDTTDEESDEDDLDSDVESEMDIIDKVFKKYRICSGWQTEETKPISIAVDHGTGNEKEFEEMELEMKKKLKSRSKKPSPAKSPDITEAPKTPTKPNNVNYEKSESPVRGRGVKRKNSEELEPVAPEKSSTFTSKKLSIKPRNVLKVKKSRKSQPPPKIKIPAPIPLEELESEDIKAKESSEETTSADEGENGPLPLEESSRVMSPVFSEVIRSSFIARGRGRGLRGRVGMERKRNNISTSPSKVKTGKHRPRTPSQKSGKAKGSNSTTGSRRKSKLNEKIDYDEVLMDLDNNEVEKQQLSPYTSNDDVSKRFQEIQEHERSIDGRTAFKDYRSSEECVTYTETLPINFNPDDMEQVNDGVFKRPLPPSRGPKHWEILDARLTHEERISDENISKHDPNPGEGFGTHHQNSETSMMANHINDLPNPSSLSKSPDQMQPHKKQRIKSPLIVNPNINPPNVSKVPLPAPVFSTSLNAVNKKRSKPISVVDSLNLHLPTSATASSLAASSNNRRPGTSTGCSMFSNSSALIAGARGTAPGILQQQRKAQPHILANSKVHQRTFLPAVNSSICSGVNVNTNILPVAGSPVTLACPSNAVAANPSASAQAVQISNSPIPISAISSVTPTAIPFQSFPAANSPNLNINTPGMPIGHVNRSAAGTNIIFVQKANGPTVASSTAVPNNVYPLKTPPRAVILRRTQIPRQGNVMILDMQKNQLVGTGQVPPFLQNARILNAPGELSMLNIQQQANSSPRKSGPSPSPIIVSQSSSSSSIQNVQPPSLFQKPNETTSPVSTESFVVTVSEPSSGPVHVPVVNATVDANAFQQDQITEKESPSNTETSTQVQEVSQDAQYAQIEAELMQMEEGNFEDVVYEEEVTTEVIPLEEGVVHEQYIYDNNTCTNSDGEAVIQESHNASSASGSSTDTASENEVSIHTFESPEHDNNRLNSIKTVALSPMGEAKIASEAISRAISLSKASPNKRLTFTTPITSGTTTFSIGRSITCSMANESIMSSLPIMYQASTASLKSPAIVIEGDSAASFQLGKSQVPIEVEVTMHNNDVHEHTPTHLQENVNTG